MAEEYSRAISKVVVAQITADAGFEAVQQSALDALADMLLRCLGGLGAGTRAFAELAGRTDCNINDLVCKVICYCLWLLNKPGCLAVLWYRSVKSASDSAICTVKEATS